VVAGCRLGAGRLDRSASPATLMLLQNLC